MGFLEHTGEVEIRASPGVLDHLETALRKYGAYSCPSEDEREVAFRVHWYVYGGPLFHASAGRLRLSGDGLQLLYRLSYRRSAVLTAGAAVLASFVIPHLLAEPAPLAWRVAFAVTGWFWLWGSWRVLMPRRFRALLRSELDSRS